MLTIEYRVHIWQVLLQLSFGETCQIWTRFKECNRYFCEIEYFAYGEIDELSFVTSTPAHLDSDCSLLVTLSGSDANSTNICW